MKIVIGKSINLKNSPEILTKTVKQFLTIQNPKWVENNKMGRWNKNVPKTLKFYEKKSDGISIPRGFMRQLINLCYKFDTKFEIVDKRRKLKDVEIEFKGKLKNFQKEAVENVLKKQFGVLTAPTGAGKTVMLLYIVAQRKQPTLIVVHTKDLANQWMARIETFLGIPKKEIGFVGNGKVKIGEKITVAMVQSLYKRTEEVIPFTGHLVIDECHRAPSRTFNEAVSAFDSYYMTGLSATPFRRDKLSNLIFWYLGECAYEIDKSLLEDQGDILKAEIIFRETEFDSPIDAAVYYTKLMGELILDRDRNELILNDIIKEMDNTKGTILVLSDRKMHCEIIKSLLASKHGIESHLMTGDLSVQERTGVLEELKSGNVKILIATSQLIGEGFDAPELSTLFLIYPVKFQGRLIQYIGRVLRPAPGKDNAKVYDYVDSRIGVLEAAARSRSNVYFG